MCVCVFTKHCLLFYLRKKTEVFTYLQLSVLWEPRFSRRFRWRPAAAPHWDPASDLRFHSTFLRASTPLPSLRSKVQAREKESIFFVDDMGGFSGKEWRRTHRAGLVGENGRELLRRAPAEEPFLHRAEARGAERLRGALRFLGALRFAWALQSNKLRLDGEHASRL